MDKFEELRKYKELLDEGIITADEFEVKKKEVLDFPISGESSSSSNNNTLGKNIDNVKNAFSGLKKHQKGNTENGGKPLTQVLSERILENDTSINNSLDNKVYNDDLTFDPKENLSRIEPSERSSSNHNSKTKLIFIGIGVLVLVILFILIGGSRNKELKMIKGSWDFVEYTKNGNDYYVRDTSDFGSLTINDDQFDLILNSDKSSGTIKFDRKDTSTATAVYLYDFCEEATGNTFKVGYIPDNTNLITICMAPYLDTDNSLTFMKTNSNKTDSSKDDENRKAETQTNSSVNNEKQSNKDNEKQSSKDNEKQSSKDNEKQYNKAISLLDSGDYIEAQKIFINLGDYKDSKEQIINCKIMRADNELELGHFEEALGIYKKYSDNPNVTNDKINQCKEWIYQRGLAYYNNGDYDMAIYMLEKTEGYSDSQDYIKKCEDKLAEKQ